MLKTIEDLKNECVRIFGLEHENTKSFFQDCEYVSNVEYLESILKEMLMYEKINNSEVAHAIVELSTGDTVVVELINKHFDFYASAWQAIDDIIRYKYMAVDFIQVLDIITD